MKTDNIIKHFKFLNRNMYADGTYRTYLRGVLHIILSIIYFLKIIYDFIYYNYNYKYYIYTSCKLYSYSMSAILHTYPFCEINNCHLFSVLDWMGIVINGVATSYPFINDIYINTYFKFSFWSSILMGIITLGQLKSTKYNLIFLSNLFRWSQIYLVTFLTFINTFVDTYLLNFSYNLLFKHLFLYIAMFFAFLKYTTKKNMKWHFKDYNDYHEDFHFFIIIYDIFSYQLCKKYFLKI